MVRSIQRPSSWLGTLLVAAALLCVPAAGRAHFVFLQSSGGSAPWEARVLFLENPHEIPERMPDRIAATTHVWLRTAADQRRPLDMSPAERGGAPTLMASIEVNAPCALESRTDYGVYGTFKLTYFGKHLRLPPAATKADAAAIAAVSRSPESELDIEPTLENDTTRLTVRFQGTPQEGVSVTVTDAEGETHEVTTDANGVVTVPDKQHRAMAALAHLVRNEDAGQHDGEDFRGAHYYASLTWRRPAAAEVTAATHSAGTHENIAADVSAVTVRLAEPLASFGAVVVQGQLYVYGGHRGREHEHTSANVSDEFRSLDIAQPDRWVELPSRGPRQGLALAAHRGSLYLVGGMEARNGPDQPEDLHSIADVARFDNVEQTWTTLPALPRPRSSHDAAVVGGRLYVVGGWCLDGAGDGEWHTDALMMELAADEPQWQRIADPPFVKRALACAEHRGKLVAIGGMDDQRSIDRSVWLYDPADNTWTKGADFPGEGMNGFGVGAWQHDGLLLASGSDGNIYQLSADGSAWTPRGQLAQPRFFHRFITVAPGRLWAIGGASHAVGHMDGIEQIWLKD